MTQALSDAEENVVYRVINGLRTMTEKTCSIESAS